MIDTIFVKDILRWNYFSTERKRFYSVKEKTLDGKIFLFLIVSLSLYFSPFVFVFLDYQYFRLFLFISFFFVFFLNRNNSKIFNVLIPIILFLFISIINEFIFIFLVDFKNIFNNNVFNFLFAQDMQLATRAEKSIGKAIILQFISFWIFLCALLSFAFIMRKKIFEKMKKIQDYFFSFSIFGIFIILFYLWFFYINGSIGDFDSFSITPLSQNQQYITYIYHLSSQTGKIFFLFYLILIGPIWEELFFRYAIFALFGRQKIILAIVFSSFLFVFAHFNTQDFQNDNLFTAVKRIFLFDLSFYLYSAFAIGGVYYFSQLNLIYPIFFHAFINFNTAVPWIIDFF